MPSIYLNFGQLSVSVSYEIVTYEIRVHTHDQHKNKKGIKINLLILSSRNLWNLIVKGGGYRTCQFKETD